MPPNTRNGAGARLPFPIRVLKNDKIASAGGFYRSLKNVLEKDVYHLITNYKDCQKPEPCVLLSTISAAKQAQLAAALPPAMKALYPRNHGTLLVTAFGARARKSLVVRGVPPDVEDFPDCIVNSNLGLVDATSVKRGVFERDNIAVPSSTVFLSATSEEAAEDLLLNGLKIGNLLITTVARKENRPSPCFICGKIGHFRSNCPHVDKKIAERQGGLFCFKCKGAHKHNQCKEAKISPRCPNCEEEKLQADHWPFDSRSCPYLKTRLPTPKNVPVLANQMAALEKQQILTRLKNLEDKQQKQDVINRQHNKGIRTTRKVVADLALLQLGKKETISESTESELLLWLEFESKVANLHRPAGMENAAVNTPRTRNSRGKKRKPLATLNMEAFANVFVEPMAEEE